MARFLSFRVSEAEKMMIQDAAIKEGKSVSEYCRTTLLNQFSNKLTNEAILNRLNQIDHLVDFVASKSSSTTDNLNLLVELLLILRSSAKPDHRKMITREMERLGITPWQASTQDKE